MAELETALAVAVAAVKIPGGAAAIFTGCRRIGIWLEREADKQWKDALRKFLRSGSWLPGGSGMLAASAGLFDKVYGDSYFNALAVKRCIQITFVVSFTLYAILNWIDFHSVSLERYLFRFAASVPVDFLSIMRVRYLLRQLAKANHPVRVFIMSALLDLAVIFYAYDALEWLTTQLESSGVTTVSLVNWANSFGQDLWSPWNVLHYGHEMLLLKWPDSAFLYSSFAPSLMFYLYCFGAVLSKFIGVVSRAVSLTSSHLRFSRPFAAVFSIIGSLLSAIWVSAAVLM